MPIARAVSNAVLHMLFQYPDLVETLGGVHQMMEHRVSMLSRLSRLHGKLELMLTQVSVQIQKPDINTCNISLTTHAQYGH